MAGGRAEATIITRVVKDLLGDVAEGVEKDVARDEIVERYHGYVLGG
jgi:hypothetical protein